MSFPDGVRYEIDNDLALRMWDDENPNEENLPFFYQPYQPDETPWDSYAQVEEFANACIAQWFYDRDHPVPEPISE